jgi:phosphoglycerate dehydrogenase-like enzyme
MTKHPTLFITQRAPRHQQAALAAAPAELDIDMQFEPSREEILARLPGMEFLISERTGAIDAQMIAAGKQLRLIQRLGSQTYDIDLAAAKAAGIPVCYWPATNCIMVAEHTLMLLLTLAKRLPDATRVAMDAADWGMPSQKCDENHFIYNWSQRTGIRGLQGSTVGILGMGEIGGELARRLRGMDCSVLYNKRNPLPAFTEDELNIRFASLAELQATSDFLCVLLPHGPETAGMIDGKFIRGMKRGAILVNTGTSTALNEDEVAEAVRSGLLGGMATDGYAWEPIRPDNPLIPLARNPDCNVILTPHIAAGEQSANKDARVADFTNFGRLLAGQSLLNRLV